MTDQNLQLYKQVKQTFFNFVIRRKNHNSIFFFFLNTFFLNGKQPFPFCSPNPNYTKPEPKMCFKSCSNLFQDQQVCFICPHRFDHSVTLQLGWGWQWIYQLTSLSLGEPVSCLLTPGERALRAQSSLSPWQWEERQVWITSAEPQWLMLNVICADVVCVVRRSITLLHCHFQVK